MIWELRLHWVGFTVHVCPCGEAVRKTCVCVDVTLGYDLSTCLLRLSSDQSSLCQPPLPAGNFSMHIAPILLFLILRLSLSLSLSLLVVFINFLSISWSLSNLPSFDPFLGSRAARYSFTLPLPCFPLFTFPSVLSLSPSHRVLLCFLSPLLSPCLRMSRKEIRGEG